MKPFPFYKQLDTMDCGPTCLRMVAKYYGKNYALQTIRSLSGVTREGVSLLGLSEAAEALGFRTLAVQTTVEKLKKEAIFPCIVHWGHNHFLVIYKVKGDKIYLADPGRSMLTYTTEEFKRMWISAQDNEQDVGIVLLLEPTPQFHDARDEKKRGLNFVRLFKYLFAYKKLLLQLVLGLLVGSLLQLIFPFLTQSIVDVGINGHDVSFIYLVLLAQLMLFLGQTSVEFIRSWVLLHVNTRLSISILTDFIIKLMKLPIAFFEGKHVGDILQRIDDQQRIQNFLTGPTLSILFSLFNFLVFTFVIINYNLTIFLIFIAGSAIYIAWVLGFLKYRRNLDYKRFDVLSQNNTNIVQLVYGMQEIKMNTCETNKRWQWERIQAKSFKINVKTLELTQIQQGGAFFINQGKNILITFFSAIAVVHGQLTLGAMLAIQYIIGQLNSPIEQFIQFIQVVQDAMISMERLNEIHELDDEEPAGVPKVTEVPVATNITLENVNFRYPGAGNDLVLTDINLHVPRGKTTAIVGVSGSGKTTLLKMLMKFYSPESGTINIGDTNLHDISNKTWRSSCGAVMQDSYIFPDSILNNIAVADEIPDMAKIKKALHIANITDFIKDSPFGLETTIGVNGTGVSQGQKQRILIARAVYKNPEFIFFDEATNSLDANNEKIIMENLEQFFKGKTVIVAAHRLSTVKHADQIVVMEKSKIIEKGTHSELIGLKGAYYTLVKNQLELGD